MNPPYRKPLSPPRQWNTRALEKARRLKAIEAGSTTACSRRNALSMR